MRAEDRYQTVEEFQKALLRLESAEDTKGLDEEISVSNEPVEQKSSDHVWVDTNST